MTANARRGEAAYLRATLPVGVVTEVDRILEVTRRERGTPIDDWVRLRMINKNATALFLASL